MKDIHLVPAFLLLLLLLLLLLQWWTSGGLWRVWMEDNLTDAEEGRCGVCL